ncbi:hypothetical protein OWV82_013828 [Melia azedarach]|uniref:Uncharacterized protein n=1 Tax=Melia azedarach TaxID=155640 RepID=A0ACC1XXM3_MELAZ|nr:hypothetical protein OWV82_013828 [Melia azedarach]
MAESKTLRKPQKLLSDSEMAAAAAAVEAAQQLMQLSDEDNNSSDVKKERKSLDGEEEGCVESKDEITWAKKIEEIFGKEEEEVEVEEIHRPKKRRYRTLISLYRTTKPMPLDIYRKKLRQ